MNIEKKIIKYQRKYISDNRGWLLKTLTGTEENLLPNVGEVYVTQCEPCQERGGHYHKQTNEYFTILQGNALLCLEDIESHQTMDLTLSYDNPITVFVPANIAHKFINLSETHSFILLAYADRKYDPVDTIRYEFTAEYK